MSIEQILLLVVFVVLPLVQYLLRTARERDGRKPEQAEGPQSPPDAPLPVPTGPPLAPAARHTLSDAMAVRERTPRRDAAPPVVLPPAPRRSARRRAAVVDLRDPNDLRRAIVLTTILGPCRATNPYEGP